MVSTSATRRLALTPAVVSPGLLLGLLLLPVGILLPTVIG
jgi:hypothetical protein